MDADESLRVTRQRHGVRKGKRESKGMLHASGNFTEPFEHETETNREGTQMKA
jgi:hypothetical protein